VSSAHGAQAEEEARAALQTLEPSGRFTEPQRMQAAIELQRRVHTIANEKVTLATSLYQAIDKQVQAWQVRGRWDVTR